MTRFASIFSKTEDEALLASANEMQEKAELTVGMFNTNTKIEISEKKRALDQAEYAFFKGDRDKYREVLELRDDIEYLEKLLKNSQAYLMSLKEEVKA